MVGIKISVKTNSKIILIQAITPNSIIIGFVVTIKEPNPTAVVTFVRKVASPTRCTTLDKDFA
jgi:ABC-type uncharacterized transport system substrate-binding protein